MKIGLARVSLAINIPRRRRTRCGRRDASKCSPTKRRESWLGGPGLDQALMIARRGDHLVVTKLARLGRSLSI